MKLKIILLFLVMSCAIPLTAQTGNCNQVVSRVCTDTQTITTSGASIKIPNNGGLIPSFEEVIVGSPSTVSIAIQGCGVSGTCDGIDSYALVANTIRSPTVSKLYSYYLITASWTGGSGVSVKVNTTITSARNSLGSSTSTITSLVAGTGLVGGGTSGTVTVALMTPVTVANGGTGGTTASTARSGIGAAASGGNGDITSLTGLTTALTIIEGGTGATTVGGAKTNLGFASSGANSDITSLTGITTALAITEGGTGATTVGGAKTNLGFASSGANSDITSLTGLITSLPQTEGGTGSSSSATIGQVALSQTAGSYTPTTLTGDTTISSTGVTTTAKVNSVAYPAAPSTNTIPVITNTNTVTYETAPVLAGGTGATTASSARTNLGTAASGTNSDITSLTGLTTVLPITEGGTGGGTASGARSALGAAASGTNNDITSLTGLTTAIPQSEGGTGSSTVSTSGQIALSSAGGVYTPTTVSGDATITSTGVVTVGKVNNAALPASAPLIATDSNSKVIVATDLSVSGVEYSTGGGTAQAQTVTLTPSISTYSPGLQLKWIPLAANTGAAPTLAVNGLTAATITKCGQVALVAGDLSTTTVANVIYDGTRFQLQNPQIGWCGAGTFTTALVIKTANYSISSTLDYEIVCKTNAFTVTLPTAVGISGQQFIIKNANTLASGNDITLATTSSQTIDGSAPSYISPLNSLTLVSDGANWWVI